MKRIILISTFLLFQQFLTAQKKYESESRIDKKVVPKSAVQFIEQLNFSSKIKWFKETGLTSYSFEGKTKYKGKKYSIEFDSIGQLEDVEIEVSKKEMNSSVLSKIDTYLKKDLSKYRIRKIQIQYSGNIDLVRKKIQINEHSQDLKTCYELVVSAKVNNKFQKFEYLFSDSGEFILRKTIVLVNTDNLEY